jgi:hypothetical protein
VAVAAAVLLAAGAAVVGLRTVGGGPEQPDPPAYPQVGGELGDALTTLQRSVAP